MSGRIIWLTGNSGAGKTTLAKAIKQLCYKAMVILDGDEMRNSISLGLGFSKEDREENNYRIARLAKVLSDQGLVVLVSVIAPFQSTRDKIGQVANIEWVYVKRDGVQKGTNYPYEVPSNAKLMVDSDINAPNISAMAVIEKFGLI